MRFNIVTLLIAIAILAAAAIFFMQKPKDRTSPVVCFLLPEGFRGVFLVFEDPSGGQESRESNGEFVLHVSNEGKVPVKSMRVFEEWHKLKGRFTGGEEIAAFEITGDSSLALYSLFSVEDRGSYYLVGDDDEFERVSRLNPFSEIPLGNVPVGIDGK